MRIFNYRITIERADPKQDFLRTVRKNTEKELFEAELSLQQVQLLIDRAEANGHDEDYVKKQQTGVEHYQKQIQAYKATLDIINQY